MAFDGTVARLQIKSARSTMSGSYKCVIVNEFGKEESTAQLTVISNLHLYSHNFKKLKVILFDR